MEVAIKVFEKVIDLHTYIFTNNEPLLLLFYQISLSCCFRNIYVCVYIYKYINDIFKFLLAFLFALLHICCLTRSHWFSLVISVICALEYIKHPKAPIASKFGFIQVKFKLFRELLCYAV